MHKKNSFEGQNIQAQYSVLGCKTDFKSDNTIKSKAIKYIVKRYYPIMSKFVWFC